MRIISGKYKGRHIKVHKNFKARPTTDFAKENLFNVLNNYFDFSEISVLDLFSGTGSISYELVSRGCVSVDLVESDFHSYEFIKKIINDLHMNEIQPFRADAFKFIQHCPKKYDLIIADPPYTLDKIADLPYLIFIANILKPNGWFILEHSKNYNFSNHPNYRELRKYGSVNFSIFAEK